MPGFSELEVNLLSAYEQIFWLSGEAPSLELLETQLGTELKTLKELLGNERLRLALKARGLPLPVHGGKAEAALSAEQLTLSNMILSAFDKRSVREKLDEFNKGKTKENQVSPQKLQAWQRQPAWIAYVTSRAEAEFHGATHLAFQNVRENVEDGDLQAAKLMLEITGKYNPRLQVDVDVNFLVTRVLEAVQKHVKDPETLLRISEELEGVMPSQASVQAFDPVGTFSALSENSREESLADVLDVGSF